MNGHNLRLAFLGLVILGLVLLLGMTACAPANVSSEKAIVGQWVNTQGGTIYFYEDSSGFIPGVEGQTPEIPPAKFTYYFKDETHLGIVVEGQPAVLIEVKIQEDKMTWRGIKSGAEFEYTRVR